MSSQATNTCQICSLKEQSRVSAASKATTSKDILYFIIALYIFSSVFMKMIHWCYLRLVCLYVCICVHIHGLGKEIANKCIVQERLEKLFALT